MQALSGERLLMAWDLGQNQHDLQRALTVLALAWPELNRQQLLQLPIAERDRLLLQLRALSFGPLLEAYARCTRCGDAMEFSIPIAAALAELDAQATSADITWQENDRCLRIRQANTADLLATLDAASTEDAEACLLARCVTIEPGCNIDDSRADESVASYMRSATVRERFDQLHAAIEWRCALHCPQCGHSDSWDLDVSHFVWLEVRLAAQRLLADIHAIAQRYGWSEQSIAGMSQQRRDAYLELLSA